MNLLHICDHFYPDRVGGSEIVIYETCKRLVKRGHEVSIITLKIKSGLPEEEIIEGMRVYRYDVKDTNRAASQIPFSVRKIFKRVIKKKCPDIIHFHHTPSAFGINMGFIPKVFKKRVYSFYGPINEEFEIEKRDENDELSLIDKIKSNCYFFAERFNLHKSDSIVVLSNYSKKQIAKLHGRVADRVVLIPGGVDTDRFSYADFSIRTEVRKKLMLPEDAVVILTIRRLVKRMGIDMLIEAFASVAKKERKIFLIIGGNGTEKEWLFNLTKDLGISDRVLFKGFIPSELLPMYYKTADLFVLPTKALEGFGLVTLESMSCGTPVIGTAVGATEEILGRFNQDLLIKDITSVGVANKINAFVKDIKCLQELRPVCRDFVLKNYSWEKMTEALERVYENS